MLYTALVARRGVEDAEGFEGRGSRPTLIPVRIANLGLKQLLAGVLL